MSEKTGASFIGIDNAARVIKWAQENTILKQGRLVFQKGDLNNLEFSKKQFDGIIAIDAMYYAKNLKKVLQRMKEILKFNGQMGIFYGQGRKPEDLPETINPENTKLARALVENGFRFDVIDFTKNAREVMARELATALELEELFKDEGNHDLCEERILQSQELIQKFDNQLQRRYFFHVKK